MCFHILFVDIEAVLVSVFFLKMNIDAMKQTVIDECPFHEGSSYVRTALLYVHDIVYIMSLATDLIVQRGR